MENHNFQYWHIGKYNVSQSSINGQFSIAMLNYRRVTNTIVVGFLNREFSSSVVVQ